MLRLIKLFSDDKVFRDISFEPGINLICGEKSVNEDGVVITNKQNGVGKSLAIELINFCFLKKQDQSRIFTVNDENLPRDSFVNLHFKVEDNDYIISRNKRGNIRFKELLGKYTDLSFEDAKSMLSKVMGFDSKPISYREYLNFFIKEENYSYAHFPELYNSSYSDLLKIHFYLFGIPVDPLSHIGGAFETDRVASNSLRNIRKDLEARGLDLDEIRAHQNELKSQVNKMENSLEYEDIIKNIESGNEHINDIEYKINKILLKKKELELQLLEIKDFSNVFGEDFYIDDNDIKTVFNKYKRGLGDFVEVDLTALKKFKGQILEFKSSLLSEKERQLKEEIDNLDKQIKEYKHEVSTYYNDVLKAKNSNLVKNLRIYRTRLSKLADYNSLVEAYDYQEKVKQKALAYFEDNFEYIKERIEQLKEVEASFKDTFIDIHEAIQGNRICNFSFIPKKVFRAKSFFKFQLFVEGQGSKGVNQMQAVIYDLSILINEHTMPKQLGFIVHDNLIFGSVDKESSINTLNYLSKLDPGTFQYIATVNKDDFDYAELNQRFDFNTDEKVRIELTKNNPLFPKWIPGE